LTEGAAKADIVLGVQGPEADLLSGVKPGVDRRRARSFRPA
jgi:NAD(P) transhydrogenase subunit alpha